MMSIETLRLIWWMLIGVLFMGFAITDGFDMGIAALLPLVTKNDNERRVVLNVLGPIWEGNQVWIITGAGALFAAWPYVYAVAFSGAYFAVLLLLLTMGITRPVSFKYRSKLPSQTWRRCWDWAVFIGGFLPAIIFGVLLGNVMQGLPFSFDNDLRINYTGTLLELFNPFALYCGLTSLMMLVMHGGLFLGIKTLEPIRSRALMWSRIAGCLLVMLFVGGGLWIFASIQGYYVIDGVNPMGYSNPLHKHVGMILGGWLTNYRLYPMSQALPLLGIVGAFLAVLLARWGNSIIAFVCSAFSIVGVIGTVGVSMFPFILPSSSDPASSLLVWDASSTQLTLMVMLGVVIIFLPIIMMYTAWIYRVMRGKVTQQMIDDDKKHTAY